GRRRVTSARTRTGRCGARRPRHRGGASPSRLNQTIILTKERGARSFDAMTEETTVPTGLGARQQELVLLLKQQGAATIPELAARMGLNVETVRHHVQAVERQELIARVGTRRAGRGRPEIVYGLTAAAEALFPRREGEVL